VTCSQVFQHISRPLAVAFGDKSLVWADVMVLAGCDSGKPEQITTKSRLEDAARLARTLVERRVTITATEPRFLKSAAAAQGPSDR
jgi:hypothetical protein